MNGWGMVVGAMFWALCTFAWFGGRTWLRRRRQRKGLTVVFRRSHDGLWCADIPDSPEVHFTARTLSALQDRISATVFDAMRKPKANAKLLGT